MRIKSIGKFLTIGLTTLALGAGTALACDDHGDHGKADNAKAEPAKPAPGKADTKADEAPKQVAKGSGKKSRGGAKK